MKLGHQDIAETLNLALEIVSEDLQTLYKQADNNIRRLINQAIFKALYICDDDITRTELAKPFAQLHAVRRTTQRKASTKKALEPAEILAYNAKSPDPTRSRELLAVGLNNDVMVRCSRLGSPLCSWGIPEPLGALSTL